MPRRIDVERLFEAAVAVFAERGYDAATTQEIADRAEVNEVTLFRRYGTKANLICTALSHQLATSPFAQVHASDDVGTDLTAIATAYDATSRVYGSAVIAMVTEVPRHPELGAAMAALQPNLFNAANIIAGHQARGALRPGNPLLLLVSLIAPLIAVGMWERTTSEIRIPELDPVHVVAAFLDGHRGEVRPGDADTVSR